MNRTTPTLIEQQDTLLEAMSEIRVMRRGTLSPQVYSQRRARKSGHGACGPYPVLQGYCEGKHFSRRVSVKDAPRIANQLESRKQFEALCARYVSLGEALADRPDAETAVQEALKKKRGPKSSKAAKSRIS